ncbi:CBO0543 family protein [Pseudoneobacillus sp. C159]
MSMEWWIIILVYVVATGILFFIPKKKIRLSVFTFLITQLITFLIGLVVVELGLLKYPVRCFPSVNRTSFVYEYYAFPIVCVAFNVWYPLNQRLLYQLGYYVAFSSVLTIGEVILEKYTNLIKYIHWEWYTSWITITISFIIVRLFCVWFFAKGKSSSI